MIAALAFFSLCFVVGGLLVCEHALSRRGPALAARLARAQGARQVTNRSAVGGVPEDGDRVE